MDFTTAFTFFRDDEKWISKLGVGALLMLSTFFLLPMFFVLPIFFGYQIAVTRNVVNREKKPLPEWTDWGQLFMDGLYITIALFVYMLPVWILMCLGYGVLLLPLLGAGGGEEAVAALFGISILVYMVLFCLMMLFSFALGLVVPAINIQYVRTGEFGALFRFGEIFAIVRDNFVNILLALVANFVAQMIISLVASILIITIIGPFILMFAAPVWTLSVTGHLYGQIALQMENNKNVEAPAF